MITLSQFVSFLKVGFMFTYVAPLAFVLTITMLKEMYDDCNRRARDRDLNEKPYDVLVKTTQGDNEEYEFISTPSQDLKVGNIVKVSKNERVPADLIIL